MGRRHLLLSLMMLLATVAAQADFPFNNKLRKSAFDLGIALRFGGWELGRAIDTPSEVPTAAEELHWLSTHAQNPTFDSIASGLRRPSAALKQAYNRACVEVRESVAVSWGAEGSWYLSLGEYVQALSDTLPLADRQPAQRALIALKGLYLRRPSHDVPPDALRGLSRLQSVTATTPNDPTCLEALYAIRRGIYKS